MAKYTNLKDIKEALSPIAKYKSKILGIYRICSKDAKNYKLLILFIACHDIVYKFTIKTAYLSSMFATNIEHEIKLETIEKSEYNTQLLIMSDKMGKGDHKLTPIYNDAIDGGIFTTGKAIKDNALFATMTLIEDNTEVLLLKDLCIILSEDKIYKGFYFIRDAFNIEYL